MAKEHFMPSADLAKQQWLENFSSKLPTYSAKYNISAADVADTQNGSVNFSYWLNYRNQHAEYLKKLTQYKNELREGLPAGTAQSVVPQAPVLPPPPAPAEPGVFVRAASIAGIIKKSSKYTVADGNDLGIEGVESIVDPQSMKPVLSVRLIEGGKPEIVWQKNGMDRIEFSVDRGDGNWTFLAIDTYPNYTDTTPLPVGVTSAVWKYKAIYFYDDAPAGSWSDVVSITVTAG